MPEQIVKMIEAKRDIAKERYLFFKNRDGYSETTRREAHIVWRIYSNLVIEIEGMEIEL